MKEIKRKNVKGAQYELEDGTLLFFEDWNGKVFGNGIKDGKETKCEYRPVCQFEVEGKDITTIDVNSEEWYRLIEIVGFEVVR